MRILVLGGSGLTGPHFVRRLIELGHEVTVFHRGASKSSESGARGIAGDLQQLEGHQAAFRRLDPQVVVHTRALNETDAGQFLRVFSGLAERSVVISSGDVYRSFGWVRRTEPGAPDTPPCEPLTEDSPLRLQATDEAESYDKIAVERVIRSDPGLPATILRYAAVYGPRDGHRLFRWARRMWDGRPVIPMEESYARWLFSHGYAEDVAEAVVLAVLDGAAAGRVYNVAPEACPSMEDRVRAIGAVAGWEGRVVRLAADAAPGLARPEFDFRFPIHLDSTRIRRELGYRETVPEEEGLRRTLDWYRENPPPEPGPDDPSYAAEDAALAARHRSARGEKS